MNTAERIYDEAKCLPEEQAHQVLVFIEAMKKQDLLPGSGLREKMDVISSETLRKKALAAQAIFPRVDREKMAQEFADMRNEWDRTL
ncbi:MAG: hypothetical protein HQL86_05080 [Magnetococcales bacterium]|nr:hypothetical protein [Magnetococcales bacterium]